MQLQAKLDELDETTDSYPNCLLVSVADSYVLTVSAQIIFIIDTL